MERFSAFWKSHSIRLCRIVETIWRRSPEQDVYARWPLYSPRTGTCYFVGAACGFAGEGKKRTLLAVKRGGAGRSKPVEGQGGEDDLGGLTFSPDGRYLLFGANRPDRAEESTGERRSQSGTSPLRPSDRPARLLTGL